MKRVVLFQIGNQSYGLDLFHSRGIENYKSIMMIPNAPENVQGLVDIRGELIPVYNLRKKFCMPEAVVNAETKMIIGKMQGMEVAYVVDKVMEIFELPDDAFTAPPVMVKSDDTKYIEAIIQSKAGLSILINQEGVLTKAEREQIEAILADMKKKKEEEEARKKEEERLRKQEEARLKEEEEGKRI